MINVLKVEKKMCHLLNYFVSYIDMFIIAPLLLQEGAIWRNKFYVSIKK